FNLYVVEGYQHSEIANLLQISEGTSKSQLARARQILRTKITSQNDLTQSLAVNSMHA
ncbi:MAG TPA: sigma factor-like helix-turn-helix DNA-binding protein, partial [Bacteroidia bacterium]|nr:sigma factor-like helix-turn-helix DNA-binding protein [Bacteroidia bacterium]